MHDARQQSVLRSGAFRFAMLFAAIFAVASILLLLVVERQVGSYAREASDGTLKSETAILLDDHAARGLPGLTETIRRRTRVDREAQFSYLLIDAAGGRLAGDTPLTAARTGWGEVRMRERSQRGGHGDYEQLKTLGTRLPDGALLVVATDTFDVRDMARRLDRFTLLCGFAISLFALVGGYFVGGVFLRRLDRVNGAVDRIMAGSLDERLPAIGMSHEFDDLSRNLNLMLDRIGGLMEGLRQVSNDIAHDLRTPLTRLRHGLEATRGATSAEAFETGIDAAIEQTDEILRIFGALLRIGALEGGAGQQRLAPIDLSEVMERVCQAYAPVAEDMEKQLTGEHVPGLYVNGDADLLAQLVINLVENALAHTPAGTRIVTRLAGTADGIALEVADDGPGVPAAEREKIVVRFYRADASRSTSGAGLGLSLVAAIATLHHARLSIEDNDPGLKIVIRFPSAIAPRSSLGLSDVNH